MRQLFQIDHPIFRRLALFVDFFLLNCLVLVTSLPIITIGACRIALNQTIIEYLAKKEPSLLRAYVSHLKKGSCGVQLSLIFSLLLFLQGMSLFFSYSIGLSSWLRLFIFLGILVSCTWNESANYYFSNNSVSFFKGLQASFFLIFSHKIFILFAVLKCILFLFILHPSGFISIIYVSTFGGISLLAYIKNKLLFLFFKCRE